LVQTFLGLHSLTIKIAEQPSFESILIWEQSDALDIPKLDFVQVLRVDEFFKVGKTRGLSCRQKRPFENGSRMALYL